MLFSVMCWGGDHSQVYCCSRDYGHDVCEFLKKEDTWALERTVASNQEPLLQLFLDFDKENLIGTFMSGFKVFSFLFIGVALIYIKISTRKAMMGY